MKRTTLSLLFLSLVSIFFVACTRTENSNTGNKARLQVYLTDDPGDFDAVFIDVQDIKVNYSSDTSNGWISMTNVNRGSYDLLRLVNDKDTILGQADLNPGRIQQIRLVLGNNNYVIVDSVRYNLTTPSAQQSGLKLNINQEVTAGVMYKLLMDFDAGRSVVKTGNGKYILKPVIRTTLQAVGGSARGFVLPDSVRTSVYAITGTDTVAGTSTMNGAWSIRGLSAGTYTFAFVPSDTTFPKQNKTGIVISTGAVTTVDTVRLR